MVLKADLNVTNTRANINALKNLDSHAGATEVATQIAVDTFQHMQEIQLGVGHTLMKGASLLGGYATGIGAPIVIGGSLLYLTDSLPSGLQVAGGGLTAVGLGLSNKAVKLATGLNPGKYAFLLGAGIWMYVTNSIAEQSIGWARDKEAEVKADTQTDKDIILQNLKETYRSMAATLADDLNSAIRRQSAPDLVQLKETAKLIQGNMPSINRGLHNLGVQEAYVTGELKSVLAEIEGVDLSLTGNPEFDLGVLSLSAGEELHAVAIPKTAKAEIKAGNDSTLGFGYSVKKYSESALAGVAATGAGALAVIGGAYQYGPETGAIDLAMDAATEDAGLPNYAAAAGMALPFAAAGAAVANKVFQHHSNVQVKMAEKVTQHRHNTYTALKTQYDAMASHLLNTNDKATARKLMVSLPQIASLIESCGITDLQARYVTKNFFEAVARLTGVPRPSDFRPSAFGA